MCPVAFPIGAKYAHNAFVAGAVPRTLLAGAYSVPPDVLAGFKGPTSKGKGGQERGRRIGQGGKGKVRNDTGTSFSPLRALHDSSQKFTFGAG